MRGKLLLSSALAVGQRITPAGAGKTRACYPKARSFKDHPRRCGENSQVSGAHCARRGSPPQVRGKQQPAKQNTEQGGITPAGAGKTIDVLTEGEWWEDHPRRCGENVFRIIYVELRLGSPPQVRGKPLSANGYDVGKRITPAGAGKTPMQYIGRRKNRDHPRRCGENAPFDGFSFESAGSPPQVRGKQS